MITNARQRRLTHSQIKRFEASISRAESDGPTPGVGQRVHAAMIEGMRSQLADLRGELDEYEALRAVDHHIPESRGHAASGSSSLRGVQIVRREQRESFITADGSSIRELAGIPSGNATNQSLAEAVVPAGGATIAHMHRCAEEIYLFTGGRGRMRLGEAERDVRAGDCVVIPPGVAHKLWADPDEPLVLLCCCAPAYSHEDTVLLEP